MSQDACPLPGPPSGDEPEVIERMLRAQRIAVVGLSDDPQRPSHYVSAYLLAQGYEVIPVNPQHESVLGRRSLASLAELTQPPDVVLVFRRSHFCAALAEEAIAARTRGLWLQSGIRNEEARRLAELAGIDYIQDRCMMVEHMRRR